MPKCSVCFQVRRKTSERRNELVDIVDAYKEANAGTTCHTQVDSPLGHLDWQILLLRSKFTITPGGHNPETFRMFEALEAGWVPVHSRAPHGDAVPDAACPIYHKPHHMYCIPPVPLAYLQ